MNTTKLSAVILSIFLAACDGTGGEAAPDCQTLGPPERGPVALPVACLDGGTTDTTPAHLDDAQPGYVATGVYANLGFNRCAVAGTPSKGGGWDPAHDKCYAPANTSTTSGVCGTYACGTYAPGTILVWDATNPRFRYVSGPEGGVVCLPNDGPYVVPCS